MTEYYLRVTVKNEDAANENAAQEAHDVPQEDTNASIEIYNDEIRVFTGVGVGPYRIYLDQAERRNINNLLIPVDMVTNDGEEVAPLYREGLDPEFVLNLVRIVAEN